MQVRLDENNSEERPWLCSKYLSLLFRNDTVLKTKRKPLKERI